MKVLVSKFSLYLHDFAVHTKGFFSNRCRIFLIFIHARAKSLLELWATTSSRLRATHIFVQWSCDFEVNQTNIMGSCQSGRKVAPQYSKSDMPLKYTSSSNTYSNFFNLLKILASTFIMNIRGMFLIMLLHLLLQIFPINFTNSI